MLPHGLWTADLRAKIKSACSNKIRCIKVVVVEGKLEEGSSGPRPLSLNYVTEIPEAADLVDGVDTELKRSQDMLEPAVPCFLLYRTHNTEHVSGDRWVIVIWSPDAAPVEMRSLQSRGRGLVRRLLAQTYLPQEVLVTVLEEMSTHAMHQALEEEPSPHTDLENRLEVEKLMSKTSGPPKTSCMPQLSLKTGTSFKTAMDRLKANSSPCLKLTLRDDGGKWTLDGEWSSCRTPSQVAQKVPNDSPAYFVINYGERIIFILWVPWLPETFSSKKMRYALFKTAALQAVLAAFGSSKPNVKMVQASQPSDLADNLAIDPMAVDPQPLNIIPMERPAPTCRSGRGKSSSTMIGEELKAIKF
jgi:hypothetical protein